MNRSPHLLLTVCLANSCLVTSAFAQTKPTSKPAGATSNNRLFRTPNDVHRLIINEFTNGLEIALRSAGRENRPSGEYTSPVITTEFPFNDLLASWNMNVPGRSGFYVEIRVGRATGDFWTPFLYLGGWGNFIPPAKKTLNDDNGHIVVDYFQSRNTFDRIQCRFVCSADAAAHAPILRRLAFAYSNTLNNADLAARFRTAINPGPKEKWTRRLPVPFRSQNWESPELRGEVCSPTSVSMVLEYRGVKRPTAEVCKTLYDAENRMYGNWWRAIQGAWTYGVPGYLERFGDWNAVKKHIAEGCPVIASTRTDKGQLRHAPNYESLAGHLIVITGFDPDGSVLVNDPAKRTTETGLCRYHPDDVEKIWFDRGGVGYVLLPRPD
ncbi:MAG TPA: C39 family peptidase [Phycisphaerae bacterium]|nr:C39 family peptidase [Phycisphaerae bacterium]HSA26207.1 C39 family peptidase [Phycisphaerae bacterium]